MSAPRYMLSIEVGGNKRYFKKLKTRISNHESVHQSLQEEIEWLCEHGEFKRISEGYAEFCGGLENICENWSEEYKAAFPDYRTEEDEKVRQENIKRLIDNNSKERLAELYYNQWKKNERLIGFTKEESNE